MDLYEGVFSVQFKVRDTFINANVFDGSPCCCCLVLFVKPDLVKDAVYLGAISSLFRRLHITYFIFTVEELTSEFLELTIDEICVNQLGMESNSINIAFSSGYNPIPILEIFLNITSPQIRTYGSFIFLDLKAHQFSDEFTDYHCDLMCISYNSFYIFTENRNSNDSSNDKRRLKSEIPLSSGTRIVDLSDGDESEGPIILRILEILKNSSSYSLEYDLEPKLQVKYSKRGPMTRLKGILSRLFNN